MLQPSKAKPVPKEFLRVSVPPSQISSAPSVTAASNGRAGLQSRRNGSNLQGASAPEAKPFPRSPPLLRSRFRPLK